MSKISLCLCFENQAEEAADFYISTFRACGQDAVKRDTLYYGDASPRPKGTVLTVNFTLASQEFIALNGPQFSFTPALSLFVECADQTEVDHFWDKLLEGGKPIQCGWLTDRYGVTWQIVPTGLDKMLRDPDPARANRVMQAMMQMVKLDIGILKKAYDG
jgi:predicted 3-demethylubiquinone-9 3-methyltransferase (glyoxalase superfamily)